METGASINEGLPYAAGESAGTSRRVEPYAYWALALLFVISLFSYMDRSIIMVLQVQIKTDLNLTDAQMGLLTGASFAVLYVTFALPLARWSDRTVRSRLITGSLFVWSTMTALSGQAASLLALMGLRMGVAVGEAGCAPSTVSMLSDYFPPHRRGTALAAWTLALPLGSMLGLTLGGYLGGSYGWRTTFLIVGAAGMLLSPIAWLTLKEPVRGRYDPPAMAAVSQPSPREAIRALWSVRSFRHVVAAVGLHTIVFYAFMSWSTPFYVRLHEMTLADAAMRLGLYTGVGGLVGTFLGGVIADWRAHTDERWYVWVPMIAALILPWFAVAQFYVAGTELSWAFAIVPSLLINVYIAPLDATSQNLMAPSMRGFALSILMLASSIVGMVIGPLIVGVISDGLRPTMGDGGLRFALIGSMVFDLWAAAHLFVASRHIRADLARARQAS